MREPDSVHNRVSDLQAYRPEQQQNKTIFDEKIICPAGIRTADFQDRKPARYQLGHADSLKR